MVSRGCCGPLSELDVSVGLWAVLVVVGAALGLDAASWPQVMISRPIVAATIGGALLGDASSGFLVGAILELLGLGHMPYGAAVYPETGPAGLVAGAGLAASGDSGLGPLLLAVACGWIIGWVGAATVRLQRRINGYLVASLAAAAPYRLERRHRMAMTIDALRAGALTAAFAVPVMILVKLVSRLPTGGAALPVASAVLLVAVALAGGVGVRVMGGRRTAPLLFGAGGAAAALLILLTG